MARAIYTFLLYLALPLVFLRLYRRSRRQPAYLQHVGERFGKYGFHPDKPVIWIHAVSVGETRAAAPLVAALQQRYPGYDILMTHMTPTGRETGETVYGNRIFRCYLPYDYPFAVKRFLSHFRPVIGILMETEIWFNLVHQCHLRSVPLALVNARLSEKSARGYKRLGGIVLAALSTLRVVAAQTRDDGARLAALGAKQVEIMGNLKFDVMPPADSEERATHLRKLFGDSRPVFLAASTREGEEALVLDAFGEMALPGKLLVLVPRHPQRFGEVAALLEKRGLPFQRRSANQPIKPETQVVLGDTMGEMFDYYKSADIALIGGTLLPFGGQNLIEACVMGTPVLIGPHTFNFSDSSEKAIQCGAALRVADASELARVADSLLRDPARRNAMKTAALGFAQEHRGATERLMALLAPLIDHSR